MWVFFLKIAGNLLFQSTIGFTKHKKSCLLKKTIRTFKLTFSLCLWNWQWIILLCYSQVKKCIQSLLSLECFYSKHLSYKVSLACKKETILPHSNFFRKSDFWNQLCRKPTVSIAFSHHIINTYHIPPILVPCRNSLFLLLYITRTTKPRNECFLSCEPDIW